MQKGMRLVKEVAWKRRRFGENVPLNPRNKSGYNGVYWDSSKSKWRALITYKTKKYYLGSFKDAQDAYVARMMKEEEILEAERNGKN